MFSPPSKQSPVYAVGLTLLTVLAATMLRMLVFQLIGERLPYVTFYPAIIVAGLYVGFWGGILATLLSALLALLSMPPFGTFAGRDPRDAIGTLLFIATGFLIVWVCHRREPRGVWPRPRRIALTRRSRASPTDSWRSTASGATNTSTRRRRT